VTADSQQHNQNLLSPADWVVEIERLHDEPVDEKGRNLRSLADFKNYRRGMEYDGSKLAEESKSGILRSLLDIIDGIEKALQFANDANQRIVKGMKIIHQKSLTLLKTNIVRVHHVEK
jgi:molecular chaperone GrpE (heat shock protein)